ncbi:Plasmodium exported protein (Pm-fam-a like), unknown function [Plasmodium malariae]|uniref:Fam-m protein n=1 Tax=Plasmodium malariae TaxID=5858 RepID=A0A1A8WXW9_PLAMA|nr:Plasmodium exported protein (Pm-fam-a like), unknown function [Plasmodium malariae]
MITIMEQKIKLILPRIFNKNLNDNVDLNKRLYTINCRLLAKYKQDKDSNIIALKDISNNVEWGKRNICNNEKGNKGKNKQSNRSLLNKAEYYTDVIDYNNGMFDGKHFHFEKKWIKKRNYDDFLAKKRRIHDIALKKIKFRSYGFGITIFSIFFLLGIGLPILKALSSYNDLKDKVSFLINVFNYIEMPFSYIAEGNEFGLFYSLLIIILAVIIIIALPKILRNNEKYRKIKLMTE